MRKITTTETNKKGETTVLSTKRYWEKGDFIYDIASKKVIICNSNSWVLSIEEHEKKGTARIPTQEEINNYRLEKCKKDYPVGSRFKSVDTGKEWSIIESWGVFDGNVTNGCILVYNATTNTYAEIVEQTPIEKLKEYASQQYPDDTILRDRINNLNK